MSNTKATNANTPVYTIRDHSVVGRLWNNKTKDGRDRLSATFARTYMDDEGKFHESASFYDADMLRLQKVIDRLYFARTRLEEEAKAKRKNVTQDQLRQDSGVS
ncbi:hypothetical protein [Litorimonas sp.]|uniref:hypothetical protein n=1 Tax=Litorimonas sp. TaxID=1892381 RepID=UPI003A86743B